MRHDGLTAVRLLGVAGVVLAFAASSASGAGSPRLVEGATATFPERSYVLTLPTERSLNLTQVHVTENGRPVQGLVLSSEHAGAKPQFAVVLVIDASNSMRGKAIQEAMAAARTFAASRRPGQGLAVIAINSKVRVLLPLTTDASKIDAALRTTPTLGQGTRVYDGLDRARVLLAGAKAENGSIVLLSDGADVGSVAKPEAVLRALAADHVRVHSVGLKSPSYNAGALAKAAAATGGSQVETANPAALSGIFGKLGARLSNQYVIAYRSLMGPGRGVTVRAAVDGLPGAAVAAYSSPALRIVPAPLYDPSRFSRVVESPLTAVIVAILIALLFGWGVRTIVGGRSETLPSRVGQFVTVADTGRRGRRKPSVLEEQEAAQFLNRHKRPFEQHRFWQQLQTVLSVAEIKMTASQLVLLTALGTVLAAVAFVALLGGIGILLALAVPYFVRAGVLKRLAARRRAFAEQLPENLDVLASSLRTGHSLVSGLAVVVDNTPEPSKSELQRVLAEERLGAPLEDAFKVVIERMDNRDIDQVALVARLQRDVGSNSAEVLDRVVENVRARMELRRLVRTLTAQGRFSRWVVTALPVGLAVALTLLNPGYLSPLFHNTSGRFLIAGATLMVVAGSVIIGKIVDIKV